MPLLAPVMTTVRPLWLARSLGVHLEVVMGNNVSADNNAVNANMNR
jgi:hypothetical protein